MLMRCWLISLMLCSAAVTAQDDPVQDDPVSPLVLGTFPIPLMVESRERGLFISLTRALEQQLGEAIEIRFYPPQRTLNAFAAGQLDGLFPALKSTMSVPYQASAPLFIKRDYAFRLNSASPVRSLRDLQGLKVALTAGYPYSETLTQQPGIRFEYANSDQQNVQKLLAGRVDVFVVEQYSGETAFEQLNARSQVRYDPSFSLGEQPVFYAFPDNAEGLRLAQRFSAALQRLRQSGRFDKIMRTTLPEN